MVFAVVAAFVFGVATTCILLARAAFLAGEMGWKEIRPDHVTQSFLIPGWALGTLRLCVSVFQTTFIIHCALQPAHHVACTLGGGCVPFGGLNLWATFTVWCWTGQALYFALAGLACIVGDRMRHFRFGLFFVWVLYECMFSMALMVTLTVWFVLVPHLHVGTYLGIPEAGQGLGIMYSLFGFVTHVLNLVFMFAELGLNRLSFKSTHVYFCLLMGICYLLFSWVFHARTGVWFYFFLDYQPIYAVIPYMICCAVVYCYFVFGGWCSELLKSPQHPRIKKAAAAAAAAAPSPTAGQSVTKPNKIKRHNTISSVLVFAKHGSGNLDSDSPCNSGSPLPQARPGLDSALDKSLRLR